MLSVIPIWSSTFAYKSNGEFQQVSINSVRDRYVLSRVQLSATPCTVACQAPLSIGFFRQEYWNEMPFPPPGDIPNPGIKPMSPEPPALAGRLFTTEPPVSSVQLLSRVQLFATPWFAALQASWSSLTLMSIELVMPSNHLILSSPSPPAFHLSQHQSLFKWVSSSHQVARVLELPVREEAKRTGHLVQFHFQQLSFLQRWLLMSTWN